VSVAAFIACQRTEHGVPHVLSCRALGLSESWFYKWRDRPPTPRQARRAELAEKIREFFDASGGTYGSPRITQDLWAAGYQVSENTVAKLMAQLGLAGRKPRRRPKPLTKPGKRPAAPDLVQRKFTAVAPNVLWCGDLTEIETEEGKLYLATVLDLFSRRLLGYAMSEHHDAALACASLRMAVATRGDVEGVIFHSDRGSEYTADIHTSACRRLGVIQSMGRVGSALDNAAAEAFIIWSSRRGVPDVAEGGAGMPSWTRSLESVVDVPHLAGVRGYISSNPSWLCWPGGRCINAGAAASDAGHRRRIVDCGGRRSRHRSGCGAVSGAPCRDRALPEYGSGICPRPCVVVHLLALARSGAQPRWD
jgi:putative transposase